MEDRHTTCCARIACFLQLAERVSLDLIQYHLCGNRYFNQSHAPARSMSVRRSFYEVGLQGRQKETNNLSEQCGRLLGNVLIKVVKEKLYFTFLFNNENCFCKFRKHHNDRVTGVGIRILV
jgi:hypothetical protein